VVSGLDVEQLRKFKAKIDVKYRRKLVVAGESPYRKGWPAVRRWDSSWEFTTRGDFCQMLRLRSKLISCQEQHL
jgi:hypothetical protein